MLLNPEELLGGEKKDNPIAVTIKETWQKTAKKIIYTLWKTRHAYIFHAPVDPVKLGIDDYSEIIKTPMDFGTIKNKLNNNIYEK